MRYLKRMSGRQRYDRVASRKFAISPGERYHMISLRSSLGSLLNMSGFGLSASETCCRLDADDNGPFSSTVGSSVQLFTSSSNPGIFTGFAAKYFARQWVKWRIEEVSSDKPQCRACSASPRPRMRTDAPKEHAEFQLLNTRMILVAF